MSGLGPIDIEVLINNPALLRSLLQGEQDFQNVNKRMMQQAQQTGNSIDSWAKKAAVAAGSYFSVSAAKSFVEQLIQVRGEFEQLQVAYETMLKSKAAGDKLFAETIDFAARTPFGLTDVATATKQLLAYGFAADDITNTLTTLGNVAAGVSAPIGDIVYLYGTLRTQGRAYTKDIMQFTGRGIDIVGELADQFRVAKEDVGALVEAGKVGFPEVEKAFKSLTGTTGIFNNLMEKQSQTVTGQISNLKDEFEQMLNAIGQSNEGLIHGAISGLSDLVANYQRVISIIEVLILLYGSYRAALLAEIAVSRIAAVAAASQSAAHLLLQGVMEMQTATQTLLNSKMVQGAVVTATYTAAIATVALAIYTLTANTNAQSLAQDALNKINYEGAKQAQSQLDKLDSFKRVIGDTNRLEAVRLTAVKNLRDVMGDRLKQYSDEQILAGKAGNAIKEYAKTVVNSSKAMAAQKRIAELEAELFATDPSNQIGKYEERVTAAYSAIPDRIAGKLTGLRAIGIGSKANFDGEGEVRDYRNMISAQLGKIRSVYQGEIDKLNTGLDKTAAPLPTVKNAAYFQKIIDKNEEALKGLDKSAVDSKAKAAEYKKNIEAARKELSFFDPKGDEKQAKDGESAEKRRLDMLRRIYSLNENYNAKTLSDSDQKLQAIREEYDKLRNDIDAYNSNPKNTIKINKQVLQKFQDAATDNQALLNENDFISKDIEKKKALYTAYYDFKEKLGADAANAEYADLLKSGQTYAEYLTNLKDAIPADDLGGAMTARREMVAKELAEEKKQEATRQADLLASTMTYEQQRTKIAQEYLDKAARLRADGHEEQANEAIRAGNAQLVSFEENSVRQLDAYRDLFDNMDTITSERAKKDVGEIQTYLDNLLRAGTITQEVYNRIKRQLNDASKAIDERLPQRLRSLASSFSSLSSGVGQFDEQLARALGTLGGILNSVADIKTNINALSDPKLGAIGQIGAGLGIFGAALGIVGGISSLFNAPDQKAEAQNDYAYDMQLKAIESVNKALERQLGLTKEIYGPERLAAYNRDLEDIRKTQVERNDQLRGKILLTGNKELDEYIKKYNNGEKVDFDLIGQGGLEQAYKKAIKNNPNLQDKSLEELTKLLDSGKLDEKTAAIVKSLIDLDEKWRETKNALNEEITGMSLDSLISDMRTLLENDTFDFDNISKSLEKSIRAGIMQGFQRKYVEKAMESFYDMLAAAGEDGEYTDKELEALRAEKERIAKYLEAQAAVLDGVLDGLETEDESAMQGAIKSITQEQAGVIEGVLRGIQLEMLKHTSYLTGNTKSMEVQLAELRQQTLYQKEIAANTLRTADNTGDMVDILTSMERKMSSTQNQLEAGGFRA